MKTAILLLSLVLIAGCVQQTTSNTQDNSSQSVQQTNITQEIYNPPTSGSPTLIILSPNNGDTIQSASVGIHVNVTNFQLVDIIANRPNMQNQGHLHYYLDGNEQMSKFTSTSYSNIPAGQHVIRVELANNDHSPLTPPVTATVTITTTG